MPGFKPESQGLGALRFACFHRSRMITNSNYISIVVNRVCGHLSKPLSTPRILIATLKLFVSCSGLYSHQLLQETDKTNIHHHQKLTILLILVVPVYNRHRMNRSINHFYMRALKCQ